MIQWYRRICMIFGFAAAAAIAIMILSTTLDTSLRYALNYPLPGVFELNEVLLVLVVFLGISWTQAERGHIRVVVLLRKLPIRRAVQVDILCWALCILFLGIMGVQSAREALRAYHINEFRWGSVQMPIWWAKALVPIGCWLTCGQLLMDIFANIGRLRGSLPLDLPDLREVGD